tara:strand:- start:2753 stop:3523 length:771 start_codon:yes stop_codon:yes gene_type:complete
MATLTKSDRTKVASVFFLIGIIGIVGIITYPSIPVFPDNEIVNEPVRVVEVAVQGEQREGEEPAQVEIVEIVEAEPIISGDHPQKELLRTTIDEYHAAFGSRDSRETLTYYSNNKATYAEWTGQAGAFAGSYKGFNNIRILISTILGNTMTLELNMISYEVTFTGDQATVVHSLYNHGEGKLIGEFSMDVNAVSVWEFSDGQWLIIDDRWDFTNFETEVVAEGTVFPLKWYKYGDFSVLNRNVVISYEELGIFDNP